MSPDSTEQVNLRLDQELIAEIERAAQEESLDRATMVRRLLREGLANWRQHRAVMGYQTGRYSLGRAAEEAGLSQWELMDELRARHVSHPLASEDVGRWSVDPDGSATVVDWMGEAVPTLADFPPDEGGILLVGISPRSESIEAGHYYQGRLGQRLWRRLQRAGLLDDPVPGLEDEAFGRRGHGLTDVVKRPLSDNERPSRDEVQRGAELLRHKVREWRPGLVVFAFKRAADAVLNEPVQPGPGPKLEGCPTFLLPSPYAARDEADSLYRDLVEWESRLHLFNDGTG